MKKVLSVLAAVALVVSIQSCKKCGHCEISGGSGDEICASDNQTLYDATKVTCENMGGKWVTK